MYSFLVFFSSILLSHHSLQPSSYKQCNPYDLVVSTDLFFLVAVIADGALDKTALTDDVGSEEDLYEDFRSSNHRYGHAGGGGEQLAINEVSLM